MTHAEKLQSELDRVPEGVRYCDAPNFSEIQRLLEEGTPYISPDTNDWLSQPSITITDTYTKEGRHLKRTMSLENGTVFDEEGPDPNKDVVFFRPGLQKMWKEHWKC